LPARKAQAKSDACEYLRGIVRTLDWHLTLDSFERDLERISAVTTELGVALRASRRDLGALRDSVRRTRANAQGDQWGSLTRQERRVALLAATGKTNREIALLCGVTINTVKTHLRHVHAKLGTRSDWEVATVLTARRSVATCDRIRCEAEGTLSPASDDTERLEAVSRT
jgi:DNA-binding CsgD family transcriptional regulator